MPSVITDPKAYAQAIIARRKALQAAQSASPPLMAGDQGWVDPMTGLPIGGSVSPAVVPPGVVSPQPEPKPSLDPAAAGAQGFNIPNYIPDAQTEGGSGNYMSRVPMDAPQETRGGIGSDYVAGGPQSSDVPAAGATNAQNDFFSFFGKPQATDAMTAFGAAMLKGKNFAEGLADASVAVNNVATKYRPLTDAEATRMRQISELQKKLKGDEYAAGQVGYAPGLGYIPTRINKTTGFTEYQLPGGTFTTNQPPGFMQRTDSNAGENATMDAKAFDKDYSNYEQTRTTMSQFDDMITLAPKINAGGDMFSVFKRNVNSVLGTDFGANLSDTQYFEKLERSAQLELAQGQKGLGQFTEMERKIVAEANPNINTREATIIQVATRLKLQAQMKAEIVDTWANMSEEEKAKQGGYRKYAVNKIAEFRKDYESRYKDAINEAMSRRGGTTSSSGANISEADKIVGF